MIVLLIVIIIVIIIIIELYSYFINYFLYKNDKEKTEKTEIAEEKYTMSNLKFEKVELNESQIIDIESCYIYTNINENLFIKKNNEFTLMQPDRVYNITSKCELDIIFIKKPIVYFISKK